MTALRCSVAALVASLAVLCAAPGDVGFVEDFALAADRTVPLKELIVGTPEYYYYHCLHYQNIRALDKAEDMLQRWVKKHGHTSQVEEMLNRQALLRYPDDPKRALTRLRERLNLHFNHARRERERETHYATELDPRLLSREVLDRQAFTRNSLLGGFSSPAYRRLAAMDLSWERRRALLEALELPDLPNLVELVVADLQQKGSRGFGSFSIHRAMLLSQLDACAERLPVLLSSDQFVQCYMRRLAPGNDEDDAAPAVRLAYLERLQAFADRLPPVWNGLRANVLYRRLEFDRTQDVYDRGRFLAYLRLPRRVAYIRREYLEKREFQGVQTGLDWSLGGQPLIGVPIGNDESLVRAYLHRFLADNQPEADFVPYLEDSYLKEVQAEANILAGTGDQERWHAMIAPGTLRALKERVDIELLPTCRPRFALAEPVVLHVGIKNVDSLLVRVYEINTFNYYQSKGKEVDTAVDLDGLVANQEQAYTYKQPALQRHVETFRFPELNRPGVWVVELIGNGRSSRAVIRKGRLRFTERTGAAGHVFQVYDDQNEPVKDAVIWLGKQEFRPDENGGICVPFSTQAGQKSFVLKRGEFCTLGQFRHVTESYALQLDWRLPLEALVQGETARLLLKPLLTVQGVSVDVGLLKDVSVTLTTTDIQGIQTTKVYQNLVFRNEEMTACEFRVPADLQSVSFQIDGKVRNVSCARDDQLRASDRLEANSIDRAPLVPSWHLRPTRDGYFLELLGKTGEPLPGRVASLKFSHPEYSFYTDTTLQTDEAGRIRLGALSAIRSLVVTGAGAQYEDVLRESRDGLCSYPTTVRIAEGESLELPFPGGSAERVSLLALVRADRSCFAVTPKGMEFVADEHDQVRVADGFLHAEGLKAGDYLLVLRDATGETGAQIVVTVVPGPRRSQWIVGRKRVLPARPSVRLGIAEASVAEADGKQRLTVKLRHATADTRVYVLAEHYERTSWFGGNTWVSGAGMSVFGLPICQYVSGRDLGDEFRYVLERRGASRRPGNLLTKPSLLLNPWALGETQTGQEQLRQGGAYRRLPAPSAAMAKAGAPATAAADAAMFGEPGGGLTLPNYDFLLKPALVAENLVPDADGTVSLDLDLGGRQYVRVLATNGRDAVQQPVLLPYRQEPSRDLRLLRELPAEKHFSEQKKTDIVAANTPFVVPDMRSSKVRAYTTLAEAYGLLKTLGGDATLAEFEFVCRWPKLSDEEKRTLYGKYACHELSFFVYCKDRAFFDQVVKPHLANKKDKTFLDHWLLGDDLAAYLEPWAYGRLNVVERILLGQRLPAETAGVRRHVQDRFDLIPPDVEAFNRRFDTAVKSAALDTSGGLELEEVEATFDAPPAPKPTAPASAVREKRAAHRLSLALQVADKGAVKKAEEVKKQRKMVDRAGVTAGKELAKNGERYYADFDGDALRRENQRQLFRALDRTKEWVENNYYHVPVERQNADLVQVNGFWRDYAAHEGKGPFLSACFPEAAGSFTEMLLALAVLDLPFEAKAAEPVYDGASMTLTPKHSIIVFHQQTREAAPAAEKIPLLLAQNFFAADDRYRHEGNQRYDKFVTEEFQSGRVYGCQVVATNPTSTPQEIDLLLRIPQGAIPVANGFRTRGVHVAIGSYQTQTIDYFFYFPQPGEFPLYPVHASQNGELLAFAAPFGFHVVEKLTKIDTTSWDYVSQYGSADEVIAFLKAGNIDRLDLGLIAFRMKDKAFFGRALPLLRARHVFQPVLWSYSVMHDDPEAMREYLPHTAFADQCGMAFTSPLLVVDPVARIRYQHKEYWPLVNARAHRVGERPRILNRQFHQQYTDFLTILAYRPLLADEENLTLAVYLLLQDRVDEALAAFAKVDRTKLDEVAQYDYLKAYLALSESDVRSARRIARGYQEYAVPRWQKLFAEVVAQCDEIEGEGTAVIDKENRDQAQTALASTQPSFELAVENGEIRLDYQNLEEVRVNFYRMDLELLFSRAPFMMEVSDQFSVIRPNATQTVRLAKGKPSRTIAIPNEFEKVNTMVEVVGGGNCKAKPYFPSTMTVQKIEAYGQVKVTRAGSRKPLPAVYVKVYAKQANGTVVFFKDGYTDLRGRFDYASVSTGDIGQVAQFAILILSDEFGAVVAEAVPPTR